jgi:hypothetical protein
MSTPQNSAPLDGCTTIDAAKGDQALKAARDANPHAPGNSTTKEAVENLLSCETKRPKPGPANLVGHGCEGDIDTGKDVGQCITSKNTQIWTPQLENLADKVTELFLFGCSVGAGPEGADLLHQLAQVIKAPVSAPTGLISFTRSGYKLEPGAVWQTATPTERPEVIDPPAHGGPHAMAQSSGPSSGGTLVREAHYTPHGDGPPAPEHVSMALANEVLWDEEVVIEGELLAKVTGHLNVRVVKANQTTEIRSLIVYNHVVLYDVDRGVYYRTSTAYRSIAKAL